MYMGFRNIYELARWECYNISKGLQPNGEAKPKVKSTPVISTFDKTRDNLKKNEIKPFPLLPMPQPKKVDYFGNF